MKTELPPTAHVAPEFILRVLVDEHRQQATWDPEADPLAVLTFATTIDEWREARDLVGWRELGRALNKIWEIAATDAEWRAVLEPSDERTLEDVCAFLSARAELPQLVPRGFLGARNLDAAAFLGIRAYLAAAGQDVQRLRPSTPLAPYLRTCGEVFLTFGAQTSPNALPPMKVEHPAYERAFSLLAWSLLTLVLAGIFEQPWAVIGAIVVLVGAWVAINFIARHVLPRRVTLGKLETFADYASCLAKGESATA